MKKIIDESLKELDKAQLRLKALDAIKVECETLLNQTFFSKDCKGLFNPILIISIVLEIYFREIISNDVSLIWYWGNIVFAVLSFVGIFSTTLIYFRWIYNQRRIKIVTLEIEFRLQYVKNLLVIYETQIKSAINEQS